MWAPEAALLQRIAGIYAGDPGLLVAALLNRARCKTMTENTDGALDDLERALRLAPYYRDEVEKDDAFKSLRKSERYQAIIAGDTQDDEDISLDIDVE